MSQALLILLYNLNKGLWLALLIPDSHCTFVTQYNNKAAVAIHCFVLETTEWPLEAQTSPWRSSVVLHHLQGMKCMQQSTWTGLTSFLSSAWLCSDPVDQLFYLVSKSGVNFPFPSVSGAWPVHCYYTCLWSSCFLQLQVSCVSQHIQYLSQWAGTSRNSCQGCSSHSQGPSWRRSSCTILTFDNSDPLSSAHKVLVWFKTVQGSFSPAYTVKGAALPCHRIMIFFWYLCLQVYILLKACFHGDNLCPA